MKLLQENVGGNVLCFFILRLYLLTLIIQINEIHCDIFIHPHVIC
jgi:hypothetical protein